ncbi:MarR family winged helix-turn-helix transcriptional regulator [Microbacterium sp. MC2]
MPKTVVLHEGEHLYAEEPSTEAGRLLSTAILHFRNSERVQTDRSLAASGMASLDLTALRYLVQGHREQRNISPKDLMIMLDTSSATVTNVVDRLVRRGYVTRQQHPHDRRAHFLFPSQEAIDHVDRVFGAHHSAIVEVIETLPPHEAEIAAGVIDQLTAALDRLAARTTTA